MFQVTFDGAADYQTWSFQRRYLIYLPLEDFTFSCISCECHGFRRSFTCARISGPVAASWMIFSSSPIHNTSFLCNGAWSESQYFKALPSTSISGYHPLAGTFFRCCTCVPFLVSPNVDCTALWSDPKSNLSDGPGSITNKSLEANIKSNCAYLRPVVFTYKQDYIDVHHS